MLMIRHKAVNGDNALALFGHGCQYFLTYFDKIHITPKSDGTFQA
jgi:hypothetical protein